MVAASSSTASADSINSSVGSLDRPRRRGAQSDSVSSALADAQTTSAASDSFAARGLSDPAGREGAWTPSYSLRYWKQVVLIIVLTLVLISAITGALPLILERIGCSSRLFQCMHMAFATWLAVQFLFNLVATVFTDPGGCRSIRPSYEPTGQFQMKLEAVEHEAATTLLYAPSFCEHCKHWKPPRSHHCSSCRRCVLRMEKHCSILGNCVGVRNHGHYFLMYSFAILGLVYSIVMCTLSVLVTIHGRGDLQFGDARAVLKGHFSQSSLLLSAGAFGIVWRLAAILFEAAGAVIAIATAVSLIGLVVVLVFGISALHLALTGTTNMELQYPLKEHVQIKDQVYCPLGPGFYSQAWHENVTVLLGKDWRWRLLLPTRGGVPDTQQGLSPKPSIEGAQALRYRIREVEEEGVKHQVSSCADLGINEGPAEMRAGAAV
eukprot:TRINITY_DN32154_c0_g1_i1.p1 TRINITY_DN32154_c0_g1~~TRINITY_DN32154_c0_g1_i1.p1  ORF type:complete len:448 (+),score=50.51 TRINITY_DN32154_c0_g1_i1:42-1346(+)